MADRSKAMKLVERMGQINFEGNIIPHNWFNHLRFDNGKPHTNAIILLSEIVYWYRPTVVKDEATGRVLELRKKFKADKLQRSYDSFADQFGFTKRQVKEALKFLERLGIITLEFRHITTDAGAKLANVLFIEPDPDKIEFITHVTLERKTYDSVTVDLYTSNDRHPTLECQTNTETTTETTTETKGEGASAAPDYLTDVFNGHTAQQRAGIADPSQDLAAYMQTADEFINIYRQRTGLWPDTHVQKPAIKELASDGANLDLWDNVVTAWVKIGWNKRNVAGMIEHYQRGEIPSTGGQRGKNSRQRSGNNISSQTPAAARGLGPRA